MAHERAIAERRINGLLEERLDSAAGGCLDAAVSPVRGRDDRWYGQLLVLSHDSVAAEPNPGSTLPAAAAIELLREYCRRRERLLVSLDEGSTDPSHRGLTAELLASDYLYTSAYSTLGTLGDDRLTECFEALSTISESIIETFGDGVRPSALTPPEYCSFVEDTAGALGRGAAVIGASLAGADEPLTDYFAVLGRGAGTARRLRPTVDAGSVEPPSPDGRRLRRRANRGLDDAEDALDELASAADVAPLRAFLADLRRSER